MDIEKELWLTLSSSTNAPRRHYLQTAISSRTNRFSISSSSSFSAGFLERHFLMMDTFGAFLFSFILHKETFTFWLPVCDVWGIINFQRYYFPEKKLILVYENWNKYLHTMDVMVGINFDEIEFYTDLAMNESQRWIEVSHFAFVFI